MSRAAVVAEARAWIGTPFRPATAARGIGCDCLGLVIGVRRAVHGVAAAPDPQPWRPDWALASSEERLLDGLARWLPRIDPAQARAGDVIALRWRSARPASHLALLTGPDRIIHAQDGAVVCEVHLPAAWRRRIAAAFTFPEHA